MAAAAKTQSERAPDLPIGDGPTRDIGKLPGHSVSCVHGH
jgi:hypothetical protein